MRHEKRNLVQFSVVSFIVMLLLAVAISVILIFTLNLQVRPSEIGELYWMVYGSLAGSFLVLYGCWVAIGWRFWAPVARYQHQLESTNSELEKNTEERGIALKKSNEQILAETIERERLEEELQAISGEKAVVDEVARVLASTLDFNQTLEKFFSELKKLLAFDRASINIVDQRTDTYALQYLSGQPRLGFPVGSVRPMQNTKTGQVVVTGETLISDDIAMDSRFTADQDYFEMGLRSNITVPLISKGRVIGTLNLYSQRIGFYGPREQDILERFAHQVASAVENDRLYQQIRTNEEEMAVADRVARVVTSALDIDEVYEKSALEINRLISFDRVSINVVDQATGTYTSKYLFGQPRPGHPIGPIRSLQGTQTEQVITIGQTLVRSDIAAGPEFSVDQDYLTMGLRSCIMVPVISKGSIIGTMGFSSHQVSAYGPREQVILEKLANQIAPAVEKAELFRKIEATEEQMAVVDEVARIVISTSDIDEVYEKFALGIKKLVSFDRVSFNVIDHETEVYEVKYLSGVYVPEHYVGAVKELAGSQIGHVVATNRTLARQDVALDLRFLGDQDYLNMGLHSSIVVPLMFGDRAIGAMCLRSHRVNAYGLAEQAILERLVHQLSPAVENARRGKQLQDTLDEMTAVDEVARIITSTEEIDQVYSTFALQLKELVHFDRLSINVVDQNARTYSLRYLYGEPRPGHPPGSTRSLDGTETGLVVSTGEILVRTDAPEHPKFPADRDYIKMGLPSSIMVPLVSHGQAIGTLGLRSRKMGVYGPREQGILGRLAHNISHAVGNARLQQQIQASDEETAVVDEVASIITSSLDIYEVYEKFALQMKKLVAFDWLSVNVINPVSDTFEIKYLLGEDVPEHYVGAVRLLKGSPTGLVVATVQTLMREDVANDPRFATDQDYLKMGMHSSIMVPLVSGGRVIGTMGFRSHRVGAYGPREQAILERLAYQIAHAVENAWLYETTRMEKERATTAVAQLQALLDGVDSGICLSSSDYKILWVNHSFCEFLGTDDAGAMTAIANRYNNRETLRQIWKPCLADPDKVFDEWDRISEESNYAGYTGELKLIYPANRVLEEFTAPIYGEVGEYIGRLWVYKDISARKQAEEQLFQSRKMESLGRLAGGVAHDFNNLLMLIMGYSQLALQNVPPDTSAVSHIREIQRAGERAANLTNQLLAVSRSQVVAPKVIDLNELILNLGRMLRRLIGEDVEFVTLPSVDLQLVKVDPGQIEQVLMNLVINARDAMPDGGKLVVETSNVTLDAKSADDATPGQYVMLSVSDTGLGMTEETKSHIFEPFFTTKEGGEGTGLGLATCHGIITQSGGHIEVNSAPDVGTSFNIYLPCTDESADLLTKTDGHNNLFQGTETVLLAEDEPLIRTMVATVLRDHGYKVHEAANGDEALSLVEKRDGEKLDLLVTDMVMPNMGGRELAERLRAVCPGIKVLFTSGYIDGSALNLDSLDLGTDFLQKPYPPNMLAVKVREMLDK